MSEEGTLIEPGFVMPEQLTEKRGLKQYVPQRKLLWKILLGAIADAIGRGPTYSEPAMRWVANGNRGAITFNDCCEVLDADAERLRRQILKVYNARKTAPERNSLRQRIIRGSLESLSQEG